jgi:hypothetical protein
MSLLVLLAALPCLVWTQGVDTAPTLRAAGIDRICVPPGQGAAWRAAGLTAVETSESDLAARRTAAPPGIRVRADRASATRSPWVFANGWLYLRAPRAAYAYDVPAGKAALAAAEAFAYDVDAAVKADPSDLESLGAMLAFLASIPAAPALPEAADLAVVDDGSAMMGEVLNLLVRRNLLFRIVPSESAQFRVNVRLGTAEYPRRAAADPSALALAIRRRLTDEQRSLRLFGSEVVIARLATDGSRARLQLINYGGREIEGLRIRVRGTYPDGEARLAGFGTLPLGERAVAEGATEFTVPRLGAYGVVDLPAIR